jgi:hypothetical protein
MKGASLIVYVNDNGEVIGAKNVNRENGQILEGEIEYGVEEKKADKKIVGGALKTRLMYPNACCWVKLPGNGWVCLPC